ncbi:MAG: hypothetical protein IJC32_02795 [Clostridia bacterium]|nr:hypothetical protein [Clostridia bacterium]
MKKRIVLIISVVLAAIIALSVIATAAYDSTSDPLISLSYLTKYVEEALKPINEKIAALTGGESGGDGTTAPATTDAFVVIDLKPGQELQCTAATELILRSGSAVIVSPFDNQGLCDMTAGVDLQAGTAVPKNHCLLIPRGNDGRGIKITGSGTAYVMVGGAYKIVG